jgi:hypothetical protein
MKIILWIAAALLLGFGWLVYATTTARGPEPATTTTVATQTASRASPRVARFEVPAPPVPALATSAPGGEPDLSISGQRARLEDRFAAETADAGWATTAQQELHADLGRFATRDASVREVQCRASMCRIELALATRDAASGFMESWLRQRTWAGPGVADNDVVGADGQPRLVMFVGKAGLDL